MSRLLVAVNVLLIAASVGLGYYIARQASTPLRTPEARSRPATTAATTAEPAKAPAPSDVASYAVVARRNLFSPTRTEAPPVTAAAAPIPARQYPKPNLFGVVVGDGTPIAYLEDPTTKRVAGYRLGDSIAGGTVQTISADRVVLARPEGPVDIRLHDPAKPKPPAPAPVQPGLPGQPTGPVPPRVGVVPPGVDPSGQPQVVAPGVPPPGVPIQPGEGSGVPRRPLPPNLLRRLPPGTVPPGTVVQPAPPVPTDVAPR